MKKKMIIYMSKMSIGGMEKVLLNMLKQSNYTKNYDVTVYLLYSKEQKYLEELKKMVNVKLLWKYKWNIFGKILCAFRIGFDLIKISICKDKYDVAICYPYQHPILAKLTLNSSKRTIIFIHNNLELKYGDDLEAHCKKMQFDKFSKVVCVSNNAIASFKRIYSNYEGEVLAINNYIDGEDILRKSNEFVSDVKEEKNIQTFINIARHDEKPKGITKIIKASYELKKNNYEFRVILVGDGPSHNDYLKLVKKLNLEDVVIMVGNKVNPYPYLKMSNCFVFSSNYEGYGIVLDEARILGKPIITTDVADAKLIVNEGYGILCDNSDEGIYIGMKKYLDNGYAIKNKFDYKAFNNRITKALDRIVK